MPPDPVSLGAVVVVCVVVWAGGAAVGGGVVTVVAVVDRRVGLARRGARRVQQCRADADGGDGAGDQPATG